jgi:Helicase associated domain
MECHVRETEGVQESPWQLSCADVMMGRDWDNGCTSSAVSDIPAYTLDKQWNDMFQLLQEYQVTHGDCLVPYEHVAKDKKSLGAWVKRQRSEWASGKLFKDRYQDRLQKLQSIGFCTTSLAG